MPGASVADREQEVTARHPAAASVSTQLDVGSHRPRALLVEDTSEFVALGTRLLEAEGYSVAVAGDGITAVEVARTTRPELVLLDVSLPGLDGIEVCRRIREFSDAYVVMLTARGDEIDRLLGLSAGADDYVVKPFSAREVTMRIQAMRRRPRFEPRHNVRVFDDLVIDPDAREAKVHDELVELTRIEFDLLGTLSTQPRRALSRRQLMDAVWGGQWFGDDHVVDVHLANLRRKLSGSSRHIKTVRGVGYRFDP